MTVTNWLITGGVGLAAVLGLLWATSGTAKAAEKKTNTEKNKAAGGASFAAGKAAGFTQGGIDAASTGAEDIDPAASADAKAASAKTDDPPSFLKGYAEGYPAGFAASAAAKKLGVTYAVSMEEPPPPPDAPPAAPPGKPSTYTSDPNSAGFNLAFGQGRTYGKNNKLDYAPGGGQANGLKTNDHYAASKKFDADQMILWSSSWDKGFQRGWDQGQAEYHAGVGGAGGGITKDTTEVSVDTTDEGEVSTTGVAGSPRSAPLLSVGTALGVGSVGTILSVGYEPSTGTLLRVGGVQVLGIRGAYSPPILAARRKFSGGADWDRGVAKGYAYCNRFFKENPNGTLDASGVGTDEHGRGFQAGLKKCLRERAEVGLGAGAAYSMESVERHGSHPPPPPISQPLQSAIAIPTNQSYSLLNYW